MFAAWKSVQQCLIKLKKKYVLALLISFTWEKVYSVGTERLLRLETQWLALWRSSFEQQLSWVRTERFEYWASRNVSTASGELLLKYKFWFRSSELELRCQYFIWITPWKKERLKKMESTCKKTKEISIWNTERLLTRISCRNIIQESILEITEKV